MAKEHVSTCPFCGAEMPPCPPEYSSVTCPICGDGEFYCPICGVKGIHLPVGRDDWCICMPCGVRWWEGCGIPVDEPQPTEADFARNEKTLRRYLEVTFKGADAPVNITRVEDLPPAERPPF